MNFLKRLLSIVVFIFLISPLTIHAQSDDLSKVLKGTSRYLKSGRGGISTSIGEDTFKFSSQKGDRIQGTFLVYNRNNFSVIILIDPLALIMNPNGTTMNVSLSAAEPTNLARHMRISPKRFAMPAKSQKNVQFSINIPRNISNGSHYTAFGVQSSATKKKARRLKESELIKASELGFSPALRGTIVVDIGGSGAKGYNYKILSANISPPTSTRLLSGSIILKSDSGIEIPLTVAAVILDSKNNVVARLRPSEKVTLRPREQRNIPLTTSGAKLGQGSFKARFTVVSKKAKTQTKEIRFTN